MIWAESFTKSNQQNLFQMYALIKVYLLFMNPC